MLIISLNKNIVQMSNNKKEKKMKKKMRNNNLIMTIFAYLTLKGNTMKIKTKAF